MLAKVHLKPRLCSTAKSRSDKNNTMISYVCFSLLFCMFLSITQCQRHRQNYQAFSAGPCPHVSAMSDFEMDKFLGKWYVVKKYPAKSNCIEEVFTKKEDKYWVQRSSRPFGFSRSSFVNVTGQMHMNYLGDKARMEMWTIFEDAIINKKKYVILGTDYDNYAVVWTCNRKLIGHRQSLQVMSRSDKIKPSMVFELREILDQFNTRENDLITIDHKECSAPVRPVSDGESQSSDKPDKPSTNQGVKPDVNISIGPFQLNSHED